MRTYQPSMEATMFANRPPKTDKQGNVDAADAFARGKIGNIIAAQALGFAANSLLDAFEPNQRKKPEEKDFGDKFRDSLRTATNIALPLYTNYELLRGMPAGKASEAQKEAPEAPSAASQTAPKGFKALPPGRSASGRGSATSPPPTTPTAPAPYTARQDLGGMQARRPGDNEFTSRSTQLQMDLGAANAVDSAVNQQVMPGAYGGETQLGIPGLEGGPKSLMQRQREQEAFVKAARSERMPGVMQNLNEQIDAEMAQKLSGLQKEAAEYPKVTTPDYREQGLEAGRQYLMEAGKQYLADQEAQVANEPVVSTPKASAYTGPTSTSTNPLLSREPASSFAEEFGDPAGRMTSAQSQARKDKALGEFYAKIPADPETGERNVSAFLQGFNEGRGAVEPRNSGELLSDQLEGQTAFDQQKSREPFIREQSVDAVMATDEQGPERAQMKAMGQKEDYMMEMLGKLGEAQADTQRQLQEMKNKTVVPTADTSASYVKSDFLVPDPKSSPTPEPSKTVAAPEAPAIKKTTIIEEVEAPQQSMKPMDVAEKLRRIQTSGRPNARQEAQDFLSSITEQMKNG